MTRLPCLRSFLTSITLLIALILDSQPAGAETTQLTAHQRDWIARHPVIRVSNELDWPPFDFVEDGKPSGFSVEYLELVGQRLGLKIEWINGYTWPQLIEMTKLKQIDVLQSTAALESRSDFLDYTSAFIANPTALFVRPDEKASAIQGLDTLHGKTIAIPKGYYSNAYVREHYPHYQILDVPDALAGLNAVSRGDADVYLDWLPVGNYLIRQHKIANVVFGALAGKLKLEESGLHLGVRNDWPELTAILEIGMAMVSAEEYEALSHKWTMQAPSSHDSNDSNALSLTSAERAWLSRHPLIRLGVDPGYPPFEFITDDGRYAGIASDYVNLVSQKLGIRMQVIPGLSWSEVIEGAQAGNVDLLPAAAATEKRQRFLSFTQPHTAFPAVVLTRTDFPFIEGLGDSLVTSVAVATDYAVTELIESAYPQLQRQAFDSPLDALQAVSLGKTDAAVMNLGVASYLIRANAIANLKVAAPSNLDTPGLSFAVRKDWAELVPILEKSLASITPDEKAAIRAKWVKVESDARIDTGRLRELTLQFGLPAAALLITILLWNRKLTREVNQRKRTEKALALAKEDAESANRAKSDFLARMSHDVRTPMNAVLGALQILDHTPLDETQRRAMHVANASGETLLSLVDDVLDFAKIESGIIDLNPEPFDIRALADEIRTAFIHQAAVKGLELEVSITPELPDTLQGDCRRLRQVITNLVGNALKFTPAGAVRIRFEGSPDGPTGHCGKLWRVCISVCDTGIGIKSEDLTSIFEAFKQPVRPGSGPAEGFGLGLAICRSLVHVMDGEIRVDSTPGQGSCFHVQIPLTEQRPAETHENAAPRSPRRVLSILLVEDDEANRYIGESLIATLGHRVRTAADGDAAVQLASTGDFDAILMDIRMPGMNGLDASRTIRALPSAVNRVPIIALTANTSTEDIEATRAAGMNAYLPKPLRKTDLATTLQSVLDAVDQQAVEPPLLDTESISELRRNMSEERFQTCRDICLNSIDSCLAALERAAEIQSFDTFSDTCHRLKGVGALFGMSRLQQLATRMESRAEMTDAAVFEQDWPLLKACAAETQQRLRALP